MAGESDGVINRNKTINQVKSDLQGIFIELFNWNLVQVLGLGCQRTPKRELWAEVVLSCLIQLDVNEYLWVSMARYGEKRMQARKNVLKMCFLPIPWRPKLAFCWLSLHGDLLFTTGKWIYLLAEIQKQNVYLFLFLNIFTVCSWEGGLQSWVIYFIVQN